LVAVLPVGRLVPWYTSTPQACTGPTIRLLCANVGWFNDDHASFLDMVRALDPDIVIVQEATEDWSEALHALARWPHVLSHPQRGPFGMELRSRLPLVEARVHVEGRAVPPVLTATVMVDGRALDITAVHPMRPGLRHGNRMRNDQLDGIASIVQTQARDGIVIGDLNTTMWTDGYQAFEQAVHGRNLRRGRGIMPSWQRGFPWVLGIPIDHALIRGDVCCTTFALHSIPGSDHAAMVTDIGLGNITN
jgi:endonuclease/exonuclease/phosphatase (EEP) superfamily protein YafD